MWSQEPYQNIILEKLQAWDLNLWKLLHAWATESSIATEEELLEYFQRAEQSQITEYSIFKI